MRIRFSPTFFLCLFVICFGAPAFAEPSEASKRLKQADADLKKARESLHVAHQELGEKAEVIAKLTSELEKPAGARRKRGESSELISKLKRELEAANAKISGLERMIELEAVAKVKREAVSKAAKVKAKSARPAPEIFKVSYGPKSAANLDGRELALKWVRAKLKEDPKVKFAIRGQANDTEFEVVNREIAENRANFLASFFRVSGVLPRFITKVSGAESSDKGSRGRVVEIVALP